MFKLMDNKKNQNVFLQPSTLFFIMISSIATTGFFTPVLNFTSLNNILELFILTLIIIFLITYMFLTNIKMTLRKFESFSLNYFLMIVFIFIAISFVVETVKYFK